MKQIKELSCPDVAGQIGTARPFSAVFAALRFLVVSGILCLSVFLTSGAFADEPDSRNAQPAHAQTGLAPGVGQLSGASNREGVVTHSDSISQFERPPQRMDWFQVEDLQRMAAENRERSRKRLRIPIGALASLDTNVTTDAGQNRGALLADQTGAWESGDLRQAIFLFLLLIAIGLLVFRKLAPEFNDQMDALLKPWATQTAAYWEHSETTLEDEKSFLEFQAKFTAGPATCAAGAMAHFNGGEAAAELFETARRQIKEIQKLAEQAQRETAERTQQKILRAAREKLASVKELAGNPQLALLDQMACVMELLLKQLVEKSGTISSSTLRTFTQGMHLLLDLCDPDLKRERMITAPLRFLVVDDEKFSRYALLMALKRALNAPDIAENAEAALELTGKNTYDVIILDVMMPGMDGFELCSKIHESGLNRTTPVIFATCLRDFDTRAKSIICGGRDLISKPFLTFELTAKTLTLAMRERLRGRGCVATPEIENVPGGEAPSVPPATVQVAVAEEMDFPRASEIAMQKSPA